MDTALRLRRVYAPLPDLFNTFKGISAVETTKKNRREFITKLGEENRDFYGSPDGLGLLNVIELSFDSRWVYLFELVQNALDAGANSVSIQVAEANDALLFQHNGNRSLEEKDVEGLSKVFRSTKGARSVGFMGIGFKSVFMRFQEARVSGWHWKFKYEIAQEKGEEYGDIQRHFLGAVVPTWDDEIALPDNAFTTRFELRRCIDGNSTVASDLSHFLSDRDRTPLAILAMSGLERLQINSQIWELGTIKESEGCFEVTALSENENLLWRVFEAEFQPQKAAIACFLEHRKIKPASEDRVRVYAEAARARRVYGVLPLDDKSLPVPPNRGRVYATLPTEVTLPFGIHINADWLLNISRSGLREIDDNPWQRGIATEIANVLALFLKWSANAHRSPAAARAALKVLARPSPEVGGLESILAEEGWRSTLRERIGGAAVIPVWVNTPNTLGYAAGRETLVPPPPMAKAFNEQPDIGPATLLKGQVLMDEVLGSSAVGFLREINLLADMSPRELEEIWKNGLEDWWEDLPENLTHRRPLIFHLWAAVAELSYRDGWEDLDLRCIRSITGEWVTVRETAFLNEALPTEEEPGGPEARRLMMPFVNDGNRLNPEWVATLRQRRSRDLGRRVHETAWAWIEEHARSLDLRGIAMSAMEDLVSQMNPEWSVLIPFGHWVKHRNRHDLLTHILVQSDCEELGIPVGESLLADPYVGYGQELRRIWPDSPVVLPSYVETDSKGASPNEWRIFFEKAGAKGGVAAKAINQTASRWERQKVATFLGCKEDEIPDSNDSGYTLRNFDIEPPLPGSSASKELRSALSAWLEDGFRILKGKGKRKITCFYYEPREYQGKLPSTWANRLSRLEWVPCNDGELRLPEDTLQNQDLTREDAPFAQLSPELVSTLEQEGVRFGTNIPEATSLLRLDKTGSHLDATELSALLAACREEIATREDEEILKKVLGRLTVPTADSRRIELDRLVTRVGGRLRGALGGWVVPLDQIDDSLRVELEHPKFLWDFPETTTGGQALNYIIHVWNRARSSPDGLANEIRDVLPTAYAYCLDDIARDNLLFEQWQCEVHRAMVFADREWLDLASTMDVYLDDIDDRRFLPRHGEFRTITGGHLGRSRADQLRVAEAIDLQTLSSCISMEWRIDEPLQVPSEWESRFNLIYKLVCGVRGTESPEHDSDGISVGARRRPNLICMGKLSLAVGIGGAQDEVVPVNARLHEGNLTVAGRPLQFGADAAKELLRDFSFGQRAGLAADLTGMLTAIDNPDFALAAEKFRRSHAPELPNVFETGMTVGENGRSNNASENSYESSTSNTDVRMDSDMEGIKSPRSSSDYSINSYTPRGGFSDQINDQGSEELGPGISSSMGGSWSKSRALAESKALADKLRKSLKGEIVSDSAEDLTDENVATDKAAEGDGEEVKSLGDEEYRDVVAQFERDAGREPELGDPHQIGWDIRSTDPETKHVRLIEVKGKGCLWEGDEVVELSSAQVRNAFEAKDSWYLYVVEKMDEGKYRVLPIENPVRIASKWMLCGGSWRMMSEGERESE